MNDKQKTQILDTILNYLTECGLAQKDFTYENLLEAEEALEKLVKSEYAKNPKSVWDWERTFWDEIQPVCGIFWMPLENGSMEPAPLPEGKDGDDSCCYLLPNFLAGRIATQLFSGENPGAFAVFCDHRYLNYDIFTEIVGIAA